MRNGATAVVERLGDAVGAARSGAGEVAERVPVVAERLPKVAETLRGGAIRTAATFEAMPDPTLRMVSALSVAVGAGLVLAGAPRAMTLLALMPAVLGTATAVSRHQDIVGPIS